MPDLASAHAEIIEVPRIEVCKDALDLVTQPGLFQKVAVRVCGNREAVWDAHPSRGKLADHLSKRCILSANEWNVFDADIGEPPNEGIRVLHARFIDGDLRRLEFSGHRVIRRRSRAAR